MKKYLFIILIIGISVLQACTYLSRRHRREMNDFERITFERTGDAVMEGFIDSLVAKMSLTAKIGQMTQVNEIFFTPEDTITAGSEKNLNVIDRVKYISAIKEFQAGSFLSGGKRPAKEGAEIIRKLQELNLQYSENHIPVIFGIDHINGTNHITDGSVFPKELNIAATFNPVYAYQAGVFTAREAAATGLNWNFAPILDIAGNKSGPGLNDTFGEDTYVSAVMGSYYVNGLQNALVSQNSVAATAEYFPGKSDLRSGVARDAGEISPQELQEFQVPVFKAAIDSGVLSVMIGSDVIIGTASLDSRYYITGVLRDQLGFQGVAIARYLDNIPLNPDHSVSENEKELVYNSIMAGVDVLVTPGTMIFCTYLKKLVEEGRITEERIDLSVRRVLRLKYKVGLFKNPLPTDEYFNDVGRSEANNISGKAAAESIVLIKNVGKILPLNKPAKLVMAGVNADKTTSPGGTYKWQGDSEKQNPDTIRSLFRAAKVEFEFSNVVMCDINSLKSQAVDANAIVIVTGDNPDEGWEKMDDAGLPGPEIELLKTAVSTGKPVILVLIEGRPRIIGDLADQIQAILFAGLPGNCGTESISGILSGRINPSGKMAITYPYQSGHIIPYYNWPLEISSQDVHKKEVQPNAIAEFGTGLSYTSYSYANLHLSDTIINKGQAIKASVQVTNSGQREGYESVLWFITDEAGSYARPLKQLKYFEKKFILPGEVKDYVFSIEPGRDLAYPDENGKKILESGFYTLRVGSLTARFYVTGQ
jgi:beta-glucosidase